MGGRKLEMTRRAVKHHGKGSMVLELRCGLARALGALPKLFRRLVDIAVKLSVKHCIMPLYVVPLSQSNLCRMLFYDLINFKKDLFPAVHG